jgi:hypothetical protein
MTFLPQFTLGNFVDEQIDLPETFDYEFIVSLKEVLEEHSRNINRKDTGQYEPVELLCNQTFPGATQQQKRHIYRKIIATGAIAAGTTANLAHAIPAFTFMTRIYGTVVTNVVDYRPLPYVSTVALNQQISLTVTAANAVIVNGAASPNITAGFVILEYYKN